MISFNFSSTVSVTKSCELGSMTKRNCASRSSLNRSKKKLKSLSNEILSVIEDERDFNVTSSKVFVIIAINMFMNVICSMKVKKMNSSHNKT